MDQVRKIIIDIDRSHVERGRERERASRARKTQWDMCMTCTWKFTKLTNLHNCMCLCYRGHLIGVYGCWLRYDWSKVFPHTQLSSTPLLLKQQRPFTQKKILFRSEKICFRFNFERKTKPLNEIAHTWEPVPRSYWKQIWGLQTVHQFDKNTNWYRSFLLSLRSIRVRTQIMSVHFACGSTT